MGNVLQRDGTLLNVISVVCQVVGRLFPLLLPKLYWIYVVPAAF